ncbi:hypothetical protein CY34DRAFT_14556 [Suillus luteus UH-Slu-Lm8-n1]|uniref:Uncharacterized protein n=1 Tax=Suillus luteus UH-Slu-Lm8-n1 TaxID=930992 RepID=A0A0C9ZNH4_9AGAM|nr:hypothetical protein CY34DRAFT_14556 [Suillus luteus UH-Slu-Lm8-n1]
MQRTDPISSVPQDNSKQERENNFQSSKELYDAFLSASRWDTVIVGRDVFSLISLVSLPSDEELLLKILLKEVEFWLNTACSSTDGLDAIFLNLVNSPTEHLANHSFQKPLSQDYVSRCSTLWGCFLCMIVRSIDSAQSMLFFDDEQVVATLALLEALQDVVNDRCRSPFYLFLVTVHHRTDFQFDHPYSISLNILMLQLCIHVTVIERAQHLVHLHHFNNLVEAYNESLFQYLIDDTTYIFGLLLEQFRIVAPFSYSKAPLSLVKWSAPRNAHSEDLLSQILTGFDLSTFDRIIQESIGSEHSDKWPKDDLGCMDEGYSFVTSAHNPFGYHLNTLWSDVFNNPVAFERFYVRSNTGQLQPRFESIYKWLDALTKLTDLIFSLSHFLSVPPPQASDLEMYHAANTYIAPCSLYSIMGHTVFVTRNSNTSTGQIRIIPRFMPKRLARLVMYLVGPIRVLEQEFLDIIPNSNPSNDQLIFYTDIKIGLLDYPHVIKTMLAQTVHIHLDVEDETRPASAAFHISPLSIWQAMEQVSEEMFGDCLKLAMRWWDFLQVVHNPLSPQDPTVLTLSSTLAKITVPEEDCIDIKLPRQIFPATPHSLTTFHPKRINNHSSEPPSSPLQHFDSGEQSDPFIVRMPFSLSTLCSSPTDTESNHYFG